jgi:hypothetical protein
LVAEPLIRRPRNLCALQLAARRNCAPLRNKRYRRKRARLARILL